MSKEQETIREMVERVLPSDPDEAQVKLDELDDLLMRYEAAIREVRTKLEILNDELSLRGYENPIITINSRRKKTVNIFEKLRRQGDPISLESIQENLNDVAGIRLICSFIDDIYDVANMLVSQDDVTLIRVKDYIQNPKPNGYRSYHMIIEVPIFFSNEKRHMRVEVQIRTVAMDFWASLEHRMKYKQDIVNGDEIIQELKLCADTIANTDLKMMEIRDKITKIE